MLCAFGRENSARLGLRIWGLGFRGLGFRGLVEFGGLGFRGLGFRGLGRQKRMLSFALCTHSGSVEGCGDS